MQHPTTFHTIPTPVASRTRQATTAAAARAAHYAGQPFMVADACKIALLTRGNLTEPAIQPTPEEIRATIPEHGILLHELFQLFIARLPTLDSLDTFVADLQCVATQDPVDQLIFPQVKPSSAVQSPSTFASRLAPDASDYDRRRAWAADLKHATEYEADTKIMAVSWTIAAFKARRQAREARREAREARRE